MGKFSTLAAQLQNTSTRAAGMEAIRDKAGPKTNVASEGERPPPKVYLYICLARNSDAALCSPHVQQFSNPNLTPPPLTPPLPPPYPVNINELAIYNEDGILPEIIKILSTPGESRSAAADCCFRMSRNNDVKTHMSQNNAFLTALAALLKSEPGTSPANNCLLCLQNVSFPSETRETLMNAANGVIVAALAHVIASPVDAVHKKPRETAMAVLSNMGITPACKKGLFEYNSGALLTSLIGVLEKGEENENNVLAIEKSLTVCKNLANHKDTKLPMFKFPKLLPALIKIITAAVSKSKTHKEIALQGK